MITIIKEGVHDNYNKHDNNKIQEYQSALDLSCSVENRQPDGALLDVAVVRETLRLFRRGCLLSSEPFNSVGGSIQRFLINLSIDYIISM